MSTPLQPVITTAGLSAIWRADNTGIAAEITHIGLGTSGYTPNKTQTALRSRKGMYRVSDGEKLSATLLHLTAVADDDLEYWVKEVGFYLSDGTLLAVWSDPTSALAYKSPSAQLLLAYDLSLEALPADSVTITSTGAGLNLSLASPLAAQAQALIAEQMRGLKTQDQLDQQVLLQRVAGEQISRLLERMSAAEKRQERDQEERSISVVSGASAVVADQLLGLQRQDQLDALSESSRRAGAVLDNHTQRLQAAELRQDSGRVDMLVAVISNAAAVIALQTLVSKNTFGE